MQNLCNFYASFCFVLTQVKIYKWHIVSIRCNYWTWKTKEELKCFPAMVNSLFVTFLSFLIYIFLLVFLWMLMHVWLKTMEKYCIKKKFRIIKRKTKGFLYSFVKIILAFCSLGKKVVVFKCFFIYTLLD